MDAGEFTRGISAHWRQFALHVVLVFATGLTLGAERSVLPLLGRDVYGVASLAVMGTFVVSFGLVKAILNLTAGTWGETYGRKPVLVVGWLTALPLPAILILAPSWEWIVAGNLLLGANQALTWSMAINAKIDLAGPAQRGLAVGIDEAFGYGGVAAGTWITGVIAAEVALAPHPFYFMAAVVLLALVLSVFLVKETVQYARAEAADDATAVDADLSFREVLVRATYGDRTLFAAAQAGHVENFVDTLVWLAFPLYLTTQGLDVGAASLVAGVHHAAYYLQIPGGGLADRIGRRPPVLWGMVLAGAAVGGMVLVEGLVPWLVLSFLSGVGMALLYPSLMTVAGDACHPSWRAEGMGVYRMWRDAGYAVGAVGVGLAMEYLSLEAAFHVTAVLMVLSAGVVYAWMEETHPEFGTHEPPAPAGARTDGVTDADPGRPMD